MTNKDTIRLVDIISPFYTQALIHLGLMKLPDMDVKQDLVLAKQSIDIIKFIEKKTEGNLEEDEVKSIREILTNLQMLYIEVEKKGNENNPKSDEREEK